MIGSRRKRHRAAVKAASAGTPPNRAVIANLSSLDRAAIAITDNRLSPHDKQILENTRLNRTISEGRRAVGAGSGNSQQTSQPT